ncbi:hypothetical protein KEM52_004248, partial [Ascosphaera acerosa]
DASYGETSRAAPCARLVARMCVGGGWRSDAVVDALLMPVVVVVVAVDGAVVVDVPGRFRGGGGRVTVCSLTRLEPGLGGRRCRWNEDSAGDEEEDGFGSPRADGAAAKKSSPAMLASLPRVLML